MGYHDKPFCFHCNTSIDADMCDDCGIFVVKRVCECGKHKGEDHERSDARIEALLDQMRGRAIREREASNGS
jgi:hypothetical protein